MYEVILWSSPPLGAQVRIQVGMWEDKYEALLAAHDSLQWAADWAEVRDVHMDRAVWTIPSEDEGGEVTDEEYWAGIYKAADRVKNVPECTQA